jgi:hypothetical protein
VIVKGCKICCLSDEMDGRKDEEEVGNAFNEHESVSSKYDTGNRNSEQSEPGEAE